MALKFVHVCDLLEQLETIELRELPRRDREKQDELDAAVRQWFRNHAIGIANNQLALISLLLPHRRPDRMYHVQEKSLVRYLERILRLGSGRVKALRAWSCEQDLATLVYRIERETDAGRPPCVLTVAQVSDELDQLASMSSFSSQSIKAFRDIEQSRCSILERIIGPMRAGELKWFIRILLKRLDPVFFNDNFVMQNVHAMLPMIMRFHSNLEMGIELLRDAVDSIPSTLRDDEAAIKLQEAVFQRLSPKPGQQLQRPNYLSARSLKDLLRLAGRSKWAIEPKYDGEYCQVHIDVSGGRDSVRMFSKSGKESTKDREAVHPWIKRCFKIGESDGRIKRNCILEGEMVVCNERTKAIMGFSNIRKHVTRGGRYIGTQKDSPPRRWEHLMIIFFDVLLHDDSALVFETYERRSRVLQTLLVEQSSRVIAPRWGMIDLSNQAYDETTKNIENLFVQAICQRCEGLVLKDVDSPYYSKNVELQRPFNNIIKLKKDKIGGLGDVADFAIIGAHRRAADTMIEHLRQMRWTRFTLACLLNKDSVLQHGSRPKFKVLGSVGPGCISPKDMKTISDIGQYEAEDYVEGRHPRHFDINKDIFADPMSSVFRTPFIAEICGSGFVKPCSQDYYMLRFPRVTKLHSDRSIEDVVSFEELNQLAQQAMKLPDDVNKEEAMWHKRLRDQARSKRLPANNTSPSNLGSSPSSKARTSLMSSISPLKRQPVFVRMDTQDIQASDLLVVDSQKQRRGDNAAHQILPTPPPTSSATLSTFIQAAEKNGIKANKRPLGSVDKMEADGKVDKRPCVNLSNGLTQSLASDTTSPPSSSPRPGVPLADITNHSPTPNRPHSKYKHKMASSKYTGQEHYRSSPPIQHASPQISNKAPRYNEYIPFPTDQLDFSSRIFYLSPAICDYKLHQVLLPLVTPHAHVTDLDHFRRDLLDESEAPPMGPVVSESQAFPLITKAVLVESCLAEDVRSVVHQLLSPRLAKHEVVEVWDWRVLEVAVSQLGDDAAINAAWIDVNDRDDQEVYNDTFWQLVKRHGSKLSWTEAFVGVIKFDDCKKKTIFQGNSPFTDQF